MVRAVLLVALLSTACSALGVERRAMSPTPQQCNSDIGLPITDTVVAAGAVAYAIYLYKQPADGWLPELDQAAKITTAALALAFATSAVYGYTEVASCKRDARERIAAQKRAQEQEKWREAQRGAAWAATKDAANAARAGDCAAVQQLDTEVRGIDADFYGTVFVRDVAIARCLAPPGH